MIKIDCVNRRGQKFTKYFDSPYKAKIFLLRCRYGNNVMVASITCDSISANEELRCYF